MASDVKFSNNDGSFKLRVCGLIYVNGKYLIRRSSAKFWNFPAGHVELGENTNDAVLREVFEETGIETTINKLVATIQLFFKDQNGKPFHEIGYYYLLDPKENIKDEDFNRQENDNGVIKNHEFRFVTLDEFHKLGVRPPQIVDVLKNNLENQHIIAHSQT